MKVRTLKDNVMALWKDNTAPRQIPTPASEYPEADRSDSPSRFDAPSKLELAHSPVPAAVAVKRGDPGVP